MKTGFTLIEILVVIAIIAMLMGILMPVASRAREQAKVTAVNMELRQIGIALDIYFDDNHKFPPTQADCMTGLLADHLYQLPKALITGHYLPPMPHEEAMSSSIEDRFNRGHTYKYRSVGEIIMDRNKIDKYIWAKLWIPDNFPTKSSITPEEGRWRPDPDESNQFMENHSSFALTSPISWVVFSLGPRFSSDWLEEKLGTESRYPVPKQLWYTPKERRGFIVRMRLKNGSQTGSFEN
jgi:prepilin-type N-terminal cleavage/methylation domain-containing protein